MKKILALAATVAVMATPAFAADLMRPAPAPYYKAPPPVQVCTWCGFYIGANVGGSWGDAHSTFNAAGFPLGSTSTKPDGVIGGGQVGYNWQSGNFVFGIETDIQGSGQRGSATLLAAPVTVTETDKNDWFGTTRGRIGFTPANNWLFYGTGGVAYGDVKSSFTATLPPLSVTTSNSDTRVGWTAGGGVEYMFMPHWSLKVEYLYTDLGHSSFTLAGVPPLALTQSIRYTDNIARVGVNYHFGGAPY